MKMKRLFAIGIVLMSASFYSMGPVLCDELFENSCYRIHGTEHFYTVLPFFVAVFVLGLIILLKSTGKLQRPKNKTLAMGGASVVVLFSVAVLFAVQLFFVDIDGLKQEYQTGESITFGIKTAGFGNVCPNPNVSIVRTDRPWPQDGTNIVWDRSFPACLNPQYKFFSHYWDMDEISGSGPLRITEPGKYEVRASYGNRGTDKQFTIIPQ